LSDPEDGHPKTRHAIKVEAAMSLSVGDKVEVKFLMHDVSSKNEHEEWWEGVITGTTTTLGEHWIAYKRTQLEMDKNKPPKSILFQPLSTDKSWRFLGDVGS